jgi:hypothetical protein
MIARENRTLICLKDAIVEFAIPAHSNDSGVLQIFSGRSVIEELGAVVPVARLV